MAISKKLEIIYHNGEPDGIRSLRRHLSTITTHVIPRPMLLESTKLTGIDRQGIYYLINEDEDSKIAELYIGQTKNGIYRLEEHNRSKDFWNKAIMFLSDKKTFSLDIISGLEAFAIIQARKSDRYTIKNKVDPKYEPEEYDKTSIKEIYEEIKFIMATLGYKLEQANVSNESELLYTKRRGIHAKGIYKNEKFEILKGSEIDVKTYAYKGNTNKLREELIKNKQLNLDNGKYFLNITLTFNSPSTASDFVLGGSTNGWLEWYNRDGKTLDELYRKQ